MLVKYPLHARALCEFVGTFTLVAAGVGAILHGEGLLGVALAHGLAIAVMVTAIGHVSGGHLNPAVTLSMLALRKIPLLASLVYVVAQLAGAVAAAVLLKATFGALWVDSRARMALGDGVSLGEGMLLEAVGTFLLVWVVFAVAVDRDGAFFKVAGLPIGFVISVDILMIGPLTDAGLNPARWFGPNVITGDWANAAAWIVGPVVGGVIAALAYMYGVRPRLSEASS